MKQGLVVWITGYSGVGKTTLAQALTILLKGDGVNVVHLDGDRMREALGMSELGSKPYDTESRFQLSLTYARLAAMISAQGLVVIVSTVSLFKEARNLCKRESPRYFEVFLDAPLEKLRRQDSRNVYSSLGSGMPNRVGIEIQAEIPETPHFQYSWGESRNPPDAIASELRLELTKSYPDLYRGE